MWHLLVFSALFLSAAGEYLNFTDSTKDTKDIHEFIHAHVKNPTLLRTTHSVTGLTISENYTFAHNRSGSGLVVSDEFYDYKVNYTVPWNIFIALLMQESFDQIKNIQYNIKNNYQLSYNEKVDVDRVFNKSEVEFENLIMKRHKSEAGRTKINSTQKFMLDFMDSSNTYIEKIVGFNLGLIKGKMETPTTWFQELLRDKILRQQAKNCSTYIQFRVCKVLSLCRQKKRYSDYVVEWIRHLLWLSKYDLKDFFLVVPKVLKAHNSFIRSNVKFKQTLKYIANSHVMVQRDTLDFVDEVITKRLRISNLVPPALSHGVRALTHLFNLIDKYYDLDDDNCDELEDISDILSMWKYQEINVYYVIESIVDNMKMNVEDWPRSVVDKIENTWYQITAL